MGKKASQGGNRPPTINSGAQSATLLEWADGSLQEAGNFAHVASGLVSFSDANRADAHTATLEPSAAGYVGTFTLDTSKIDRKGGGIAWLFSVPDNVIDQLAPCATLQQIYTIKIDDGRGGAATETVTVNLTGAFDGPPPPPVNGVPSFSSAPQSTTLIEWADGSSSEADNMPHVASGVVAFSDADPADIHTASFTAATGYLGTFSLDESGIAGGVYRLVFLGAG